MADEETWRRVRVYLDPSLGSEKSTEAYTKTARDYDTDVQHLEYSAPRVAAQTASRLYPNKAIRVLDVAAGTGLSGEALVKEGFTNVDALDASEGMLKVAKEKNVYTKLICAFVNEKRLDIPDNEYDLVTMVGACGENHIPSAGFEQLARIVKPGGRIINVTRSEHFKICVDYVNNLANIFKKLEEEKKLVLESKETFPGFLKDKEGVCLVHRIP